VAKLIGRSVDAVTVGVTAAVGGSVQMSWSMPALCTAKHECMVQRSGEFVRGCATYSGGGVRSAASGGGISGAASGGGIRGAASGGGVRGAASGGGVRGAAAGVPVQPLADGVRSRQMTDRAGYKPSRSARPCAAGSAHQAQPSSRQCGVSTLPVSAAGGIRIGPLPAPILSTATVLIPWYGAPQMFAAAEAFLPTMYGHA